MSVVHFGRQIVRRVSNRLQPYHRYIRDPVKGLIAKAGHDIWSSRNRLKHESRSPFGNAASMAQSHRNMANSRKRSRGPRSGPSAGKGTSKRVRGPVKSTTKVRRSFSSGGDSQDFFKKGSRRIVRKSLNGRMPNGVQRVEEFGKVFSAVDASFVGHITHPIDAITLQMWTAVVKKLMIMAGFSFESLDQPFATLVTDTIQVTFQVGQDGGIVTDVIILPANTNINNIALILNNGLRAYNNLGLGTSLSSQQDIVFFRITYSNSVLNPLSNSVSLNMQQMRYRYNIKSTLSLQNRTITSTANQEADDVDNSPLIGKQYEGSGTGARLKSKVTATSDLVFYGNALTGFIIPTLPTIVSTDVKEPPDYSNFAEVRAGRGVMVRPGQIKTSVLTSSGNPLWNALWNKMSIVGVKNNPVRRVGKFRFFGLEKLIDATVTAPAINVATQMQWQITSQVSCSQVYRTPTFFQKTYIP